MSYAEKVMIGVITKDWFLPATLRDLKEAFKNHHGTMEVVKVARDFYDDTADIVADLNNAELYPTLHSAGQPQEDLFLLRMGTEGLYQLYLEHQGHKGSDIGFRIHEQLSPNESWTDASAADYRRWAEHGLNGLRQTLGKDEKTLSMLGKLEKSIVGLANREISALQFAVSESRKREAQHCVLVA